MFRIILAGLLSLASLSAASISGTVYDPSGGVVPQAQITLWNPVTGDKQTAATSGPGIFSFDNLIAGQYLLRIEKPGFAPIYKALTLEIDSQVHRDLLMRMGTIEEQVQVTEKGTPAAVSSMGPKRIRVGGNVQAAQIVTKVQPVYPRSAKAERIQGSVMITAEIMQDGTPAELTVVTTPSAELADAALDAVRQWRYKPTLLNGNPVEVETSIVINFTLAQ